MGASLPASCTCMHTVSRSTRGRRAGSAERCMSSILDESPSEERALNNSRTWPDYFYSVLGV